VTRQALGRAGERKAWRFLKRRGLRLITRNWCCDLGELDLIARDGDIVVFIEVRTTASKAPFAGAPEHTVGPDKQRRVKRLGRAWLAKSAWQPQGVRFDVVALNRRSWFRWDIRYYPSAFEGS
jgi:putative endonuclease